MRVSDGENSMRWNKRNMGNTGEISREVSVHEIAIDHAHAGQSDDNLWSISPFHIR